MRRDGISPSLPPCPSPGLFNRLMDIGPIVGGAMGPSAIGWRDIAAWQECTGVVLPPWQARLMRRLSGEFLAQQHLSTKVDCPAPFLTRDDVVANRAALGRKLLGMFKAAAAPKIEPKKRKRWKWRG